MSEGRFETHVVTDATPEMSLLELLDRLNDQLAEQGLEPISFESDCREGVCGACGVTVNDVPHGPVPNTPSCRQHLRAFGGITKLRIEPLRSAAFPVVRDLVKAADRSGPGLHHPRRRARRHHGRDRAGRRRLPGRPRGR